MKTKNSINVSGNDNNILRDVKKSFISIGKEDKSNSKIGLFWTIVGVIIALLALVIQTIIGWKDIPAFFK